MRLIQLYARKQLVLFCAPIFVGQTRLVDNHGCAHFRRERRHGRHGPREATVSRCSQMRTAMERTLYQLQLKVVLNGLHELSGLVFPILVRFGRQAAFQGFLPEHVLLDQK